MTGNLFRVVMDKDHRTGEHYQGRFDLWAMKNDQNDEKDEEDEEDDYELPELQPEEKGEPEKVLVTEPNPSEIA